MIPFSILFCIASYNLAKTFTFVFLLRESGDTDSTDGIFDFLTTLSDQVQGEFEELLDGNSYKKRFLRVLSKIFALLLNTKVDSVEKIKIILKIAIEITLKI